MYMTQADNMQREKDYRAACIMSVHVGKNFRPGSVFPRLRPRVIIEEGWKYVTPNDLDDETREKLMRGSRG